MYIYIYMAYYGILVSRHGPSETTMDPTPTTGVVSFSCPLKPPCHRITEVPCNPDLVNFLLMVWSCLINSYCDDVPLMLFSSHEIVHSVSHDRFQCNNVRYFDPAHTSTRKEIVGDRNPSFGSGHSYATINVNS